MGRGNDRPVEHPTAKRKIKGYDRDHPGQPDVAAKKRRRTKQEIQDDEREAEEEAAAQKAAQEERFEAATTDIAALEASIRRDKQEKQLNETRPDIATLTTYRDILASKAIAASAELEVAGPSNIGNMSSEHDDVDITEPQTATRINKNRSTASTSSQRQDVEGENGVEEEDILKKDEEMFGGGATGDEYEPSVSDSEDEDKDEEGDGYGVDELVVKAAILELQEQLKKAEGKGKEKKTKGSKKKKSTKGAIRAAVEGKAAPLSQAPDDDADESEAAAVVGKKRKAAQDADTSRKRTKQAEVGGLKTDWKKQVEVKSKAPAVLLKYKKPGAQQGDGGKGKAEAKSQTEAKAGSRKGVAKQPGHQITPRTDNPDDPTHNADDETVGEEGFARDEKLTVLKMGKAAKTGAASNGGRDHKAGTAAMGLRIKPGGDHLKAVKSELNDKFTHSSNSAESPIKRPRYTNKDLPLPHYARDLAIWQDKIKPAIIAWAASLEDPFGANSHPEFNTTIETHWNDEFGHVEITPAVFAVASNAITDWRSAIGKAALKQVDARLRRDHKNSSERKIYVGNMKDNNGYVYQDPVNKSGSYRGELLLTLFATHKAIDDKTNIDHGRPIGALALCCVALERAFKYWKTGTLSNDKENFVAKKWKPRLVKHVGHIKALSSRKWDEIMTKTSEYEVDGSDLDDDEDDDGMADPDDIVVSADDESHAGTWCQDTVLTPAGNYGTILVTDLEYGNGVV
ncbi:hypothetical protein BDN72DRAFT_865599 [Pluteus cervinus]|uniref:Uncharacterized protein n=1 Tax=Pluteus cervinus TaxID=181527 RepID=A0ACD2ZZN1_9AGAR|nr:hypothetical protein BDN72DRAFT_865599 [Pluteus cervinus]